AVTDNIALKAYTRPELSHGFLLRQQAILSRTRSLLQKYHVQGKPNNTVRQLSGGNAQRVLLARELSSEPRALVASEPTQGLDVPATEAVRQVFADAAAAGLAILLISQDLDEVLELSDRVAVMFEGRIIGVRARAEASRDEIGMMMAGLQ